MMAGVYALSAHIPDVEVRRSEIIPTRLARKVAPLFGVVWEQNTFSRTWVCDYGALTLAEIARGAPFPSREEQIALDAAAEPGATWQHSGRAIWTPRREPTPTALSNASINRYGPDTKAAAVLTGVNMLLRDATDAIDNVCRHMHATGVAAGIRCAVWAGLVLEAYRAQPALVTAGIQARAVQRSLKFPWRSVVDAHSVTDAARCEVNFGVEHVEAHQPHRLDLIDATLPSLNLPMAPSSHDATTSSSDVLEAIADRWVQRLLQVGRPGRGIVWLTDRPPGHREVQVYLRVGSVVAPFVAELQHLWDEEEPGRLYRPAEDLDDSAPTVRRAQLIAVHIAVNYLRFRDDLLQGPYNLRRETRATVAAAARQAHVLLGPDDPVMTTLGAYASYLTLTDLNRAQPPQDRAAVAAAAQEVLDHQRLVVDAWREKRLDPGTVAYLLEIMNVEVNRAVNTLDDPRKAGDALAENWRHHFAARGIDPDGDLDLLTDAHQYHLNNFTAYLSTLGDPWQLRRAYQLQRLVAGIRERVAEAEPAGYVAKYTSSRIAHEVAARIAAALLDSAGPAEAAEVLEAALSHVEGVLANPTIERLLLQPDAEAPIVWTALSVLPLMAVAARSGHPRLTPSLVDRGLALLKAARHQAPAGCADRAKLDALAQTLSLTLGSAG